MKPPWNGTEGLYFQLSGKDSGAFQHCESLAGKSVRKNVMTPFRTPALPNAERLGDKSMAGKRRRLKMCKAPLRESCAQGEAWIG